MTRRESLRLAGAAVVLVWAPPVGANLARLIVIYDGRYDAARRFAAGAGIAHDCAADAAALWHREFVGRIEHGWDIVGLTTPADAMVLADCARREGLALTRVASAEPDAVLYRWHLRRRSG